MARICLNGLARISVYLGGGSYAAYINIKAAEGLVHSLGAFVIMIITIILLIYQIKLTRKKLKKDD